MATNTSLKPTEEHRLSDISTSYQRNYDNNNERFSMSRPRPWSSIEANSSALTWLVAVVIVIAAIVGYSWYNNNMGKSIAPNPGVGNASTSNNTSGTANPSSNNAPAAIEPAIQNNQTNPQANQSGT